MKIFLFLFAIICVCHASAQEGTAGNHSATDSEGSHGGNHTDTKHEGSHGGNHTDTKHERFPVFAINFERVQTPMILSLWIFCACLGKIVFHMTPKLSKMFPESCMLITMGLIIGGILVSANPNNAVSPLTADGFFLFLLPPIIMDAGYFMPNRLFFDHLGTILLYAVVGTIWNTLTIGISLYALTLTGLFGPIEDYRLLHVFLFSALISAVDPVAVLTVFEEIHVEEVLFILVFGESLLNDGITVVLYHMFEGFSEIGEDNILPVDIVSGLVSFVLVAGGGTVIGILWGFLTAFVTRFTYHVQVIEPAFIFIMSYLSYLNAELFHWSGILAITFCGITMKNYTEQNMSDKSQTTTKYAMKMLASSGETIVFLFLGVAAVHGTKHDFNPWFVFFTIFFCSVYRVLGVLILSAMSNRFRVQKLDPVQLFVLSYGGIRGAIAFALAITLNPLHIPLAPMFTTTTIAVVFFTVFVQGISIKPLVEKLGVKKSDPKTLNMNERLHGKSMDYIMAGIEDIAGRLGNNYMRSLSKRIHNKYLQPCFVGRARAREPKLFETLSHLKMQDALNYMSQKPASMTDLESLTRILMQTNSVGTEWNLDVGGLEYKIRDRDINEAQFHHILSDNYKVLQGRRQSTYNRHAVCDDDLRSDFQNKMYLRARQVAMTSVKNRKAGKRTNNQNTYAVNKLNQQNGSAVTLRNDQLRKAGKDNPSFHDDEGLYKSKELHTTKRHSKKGPSLAETFLPWKRFTEADVPTCSAKIKRSMSIPCEEEIKDFAPTMAEMLLPWKRSQDDLESKQHEFAPWHSNKDYIDYYSPSNTVLSRAIPSSDLRPSMKDIFHQNKATFLGVSLDTPPRRGSLKEDFPSLRSSAKDDIYYRRGSLMEEIYRKRRESSLKDEHQRSYSLKDPTHQPLGLLEHPKPEVPAPRKLSRDSLGFDSLLNTTIVEEDVSPSQARKSGQVINIIDNKTDESSTL